MSNYSFPKPSQEEIDTALRIAALDSSMNSQLRVLAGAYQESQREVERLTREKGTSYDPFTKTYNAKCFKRHDSELFVTICERDDGFELGVVPVRTGPTRVYAIQPSGECIDMVTKTVVTPKPISPYRIERPEGMPDWVEIGIVCQYSDDNGHWSKPSALHTYVPNSASPYQSILGYYWRYARPVLAEPKWIPKDDEPVAYYSEGWREYETCPLNHAKRLTRHFDLVIARYSGQRDMRVEALKDEPRYKA